MRSSSRLRAAATAPLLIIALASPAAAAWPTSPQFPVPLCTAAGSQNSPMLAPDGAGGAYVAWADERGNYSVYATRVTRDGSIAPGWPVNGLGVCTVAGIKQDVALVPGAAGDVYVVWGDDRAGNYDIFAQRLLGNGTVAPGWPANGLALTSDSRMQFQARPATDGAGGLYVVWTLEYTPSTDYDIYATRVLPSGAFAPSFGVNGVAINGGAYAQNEPAVVADGAGNAIIVYANEDNTSVATIWGQKLTPANGRAWGSPGAGLRVSTYANDQRTPLVVSDGAGGMIFSCRMPGSSVFHSSFDANGVRRDLLSESLPTNPFFFTGSMVADGAGGAWIGWRLGLSSPTPGYIEHLDWRLRPTTVSPLLVFPDDGTVPPSIVPLPGSAAIGVWATFGDDVRAQGYDSNVNPLWGGASEMIAGAVGVQFDARAISDGADGAIVVWVSDLDGSSRDLYATRVDRFGAIGDAAPAFTRLADVPNDQGGAVSLQWKASSRDLPPSFPIARYSVWRRAPGGAASLRAGGPARVLAAGEARPEGAGRVVRAEPTAAGVVYWEYLSQVPARGYAGYSAVAPTTSDSIGASNPRTSFRIEAEAASGIPYWDSAPDSTYSVDNLPPVAPAPFTGTYAVGTATLLWQANAEPDVAFYRLYRGTSSSFVPSPANFLAEQPHTGFTDPAGAPYWYKLAAVDAHGNVSAFATLLPSGAVGVDGGSPPRELALAPPAPNPSRGAADLRFALPVAARVTLAIYDAAGRRVRLLADGTWPAGEHAVRWDGTGESGQRVGPGLYFARIDVGGRVLERRLAMIR